MAQDLLPDIQKKPLLTKSDFMNGVIYLVGLVVVVIALLSFVGLR